MPTFRLLALKLLLVLALAGCGLAANAPEVRMAGAATSAMSFAEARRLLDQGRVPDAVTAFRKLLRRDGPTLPVLNGLAIAYAELGRPDIAADFFARALAMAPDDAATLNNIGFAALRRAETRLARLYLEKAEKQGGDAAIAGNLARLARLEAMPRRPASAAARPAATATSTLFAVDRQTASRLRVTGLMAGVGPALQAHVPAFRPSVPAALIDFANLFDPWPAEEGNGRRDAAAGSALRPPQLGAS